MPLIRNSFIVLLIFLNSLIIYSQEIQEEIIVTGSFTKEIQASNPIFTSSIDDIKKRGTFRVEDYLSSLPIVNPLNSVSALKLFNWNFYSKYKRAWWR